MSNDVNLAEWEEAKGQLSRFHGDTGLITEGILTDGILEECRNYILTISDAEKIYPTHRERVESLQLDEADVVFGYQAECDNMKQEIPGNLLILGLETGESLSGGFEEYTSSFIRLSPVKIKIPGKTEISRAWAVVNGRYIATVEGDEETVKALVNP